MPVALRGLPGTEAPAFPVPPDAPWPGLLIFLQRGMLLSARSSDRYSAPEPARRSHMPAFPHSCIPNGAMIVLRADEQIYLVQCFPTVSTISSQAPSRAMRRHLEERPRADQRAIGTLRNRHTTLLGLVLLQGAKTRTNPPLSGAAAPTSGPVQARQPSCGSHRTFISSSRRAMLDAGGSPSTISRREVISRL